MSPFIIPASIVLEPFVVAAIRIVTPVYRLWCVISTGCRPDDIPAWDSK